MKSFLLLKQAVASMACLLLLPAALNAQTWKAKKSAPFAASGAAAFTLNNKIYVSDGSQTNSLWEYDPQSDSWTKKAALPGSVARRTHSVAFSVNGKGYIALGITPGFNTLKDVWEYNPTNDSWTPKADFPGTDRYEAICFVFQGKAYIGTGASTAIYSDMWEFDPNANTWKKKADAPIAAQGSAYFTVNGKGYYSSGYTNNGQSSFTYEYDPVTDSWKTLADCPGPANNNGGGFGLGNYGYVGLGLTQTNFRKFNPASNTWSAAPAFPGGGRLDPTIAVLNTKAYVGLGINGNDFSDWYELDDPTAGVEPLQKNDVNISCFPNPANDELFVKSDKSLKGYKYNIYNSLGQLMDTGLMDNNSINVSLFIEGYYYLHIVDDVSSVKLPFQIIK